MLILFILGITNRTIMKSRDTYNKWLEAAYIEFAHSGPDFSLKALAEKAQFPRATFYYHFDDKDYLVSELLKFHQHKCQQCQCDLQKTVKTLIPDLYTVLFKYKNNVLFHQQLFLHGHVEPFYTMYRETNEATIRLLLPFIKAHFKTNKSDQEIIQFYQILTDTWYIRLNTHQLTEDSMINLAIEIMENTLGLCSASLTLESTLAIKK